MGAVRVATSPAEAVAKVAENHHHVQLALPVILFLLESCGFGEWLAACVLFVLDAPVCGMFSAGGIAHRRRKLW